MTRQVVLITGAAGGVGRATVKLFAEKGWRVIGVDRQPFGEGFPTDGLFIQADISLPDNIDMIYQQANGFTHTLDAVVNNAAYQVIKPLVETSVEEWDLVIASNLRSVFLGAKLAHPLLKAGERRGYRQRFIGACSGNLEKHFGLCGQQGRVAGSDPRHGNRICGG